MKKRNALLVIALLTLGIKVQAQEHDRSHDDATAPGKKQQNEWGIAGDPKAVTRTIRISMTDSMRFTPDKIDVKQGDIVKFVLKNDGAVSSPKCNTRIIELRQEPVGQWRACERTQPAGC